LVLKFRLPFSSLDYHQVPEKLFSNTYASDWFDRISSAIEDFLKKIK